MTPNSIEACRQLAWEPAACGQGTAEFHIEAAENAHWSARRGLCRRPGDGLAIGGQVQLARIDASGIHLSVAHVFPDYQDQLAELYDNVQVDARHAAGRAN